MLMPCSKRSPSASMGCVAPFLRLIFGIAPASTLWGQCHFFCSAPQGFCPAQKKISTAFCPAPRKKKNLRVLFQYVFSFVAWRFLWKKKRLDRISENCPVVDCSTNQLCVIEMPSMAIAPRQKRLFLIENVIFS